MARGWYPGEAGRCDHDTNGLEACYASPPSGHKLRYGADIVLFLTSSGDLLMTQKPHSN
jgi:hypothetical protein